MWKPYRTYRNRTHHRQIELIKEIQSAGYAYEVNGSVYFDVLKYNQTHHYGILSGRKIEELIHQLKDDYTIAIVTHNMQQAARVSDYTAFLYIGELVEFGTTDKIFRNPDEKQTEDYITGRYG